MGVLGILDMTSTEDPSSTQQVARWRPADGPARTMAALPGSAGGTTRSRGAATGVSSLMGLLRAPQEGRATQKGPGWEPGALGADEGECEGRRVGWGSYPSWRPWVVAGGAPLGASSGAARSARWPPPSRGLPDTGSLASCHNTHSLTTRCTYQHLAGS